MTFAHRYGEAFGRYLEAPGEDALASAYELGRSAVRRNLNVLELAAAHHEALLAHIDGEDPATTARLAGEFFLEALSAFELVQRVLQEAHAAALLERRQATVLRRLSTFLADASLALDAAGSLAEVLQLVAEHSREMLDAERCVVRLHGDEPCVVTDGDGPPEPPEGGGRLTAPLTALDGRDIGRLELFAAEGATFSEVDRALVVQLAQMASAAIERAQAYRAARA